MRYPSAFHLILDIFKKAKINCILIGGFAVNHYKVTRQTVDIDFLCTKEDFSKIKDALEEEGYKEIRSEDNFVQLENIKPTLMDIDFMFVDQNTFDKISEAGNEINIAGLAFKIPSLLHLIALKLHSIKNNPKREVTDFPDIIRLISYNNIDVDSSDFRALCLRFGTEDLYERIKKSI